jgi:hypothetical protein
MPERKEKLPKKMGMIGVNTTAWITYKDKGLNDIEGILQDLNKANQKRLVEGIL